MNKLKTDVFKLIALIVAIILNSCQDSSEDITDLTTFVNKDFKIISTDINSDSDFDTFNIGFSESRYGGNDGCNDYAGNYTIIGDTISFGRRWTTLIYCIYMNEFPTESLNDYSPFKYELIGSNLILSTISEMENDTIESVIVLEVIPE